MQRGTGVSDEHFDQMINNMTPEMLKMSMNFAKTNPNFVEEQLKRKNDGGGNNTN